MAIRKIMEIGDEVLTRRAREVKEITPRIKELVADMRETMRDAEGVGLAAPQVGVLRRIIVVDVGEGLYELINPEVVEESGCQTGEEGCLSIPGQRGIVKRPFKIKVKALNILGKEMVIEAEEFLARALCHEIDHLNGVLYVDLMERVLEKEEEFDDIIEPDAPAPSHKEKT